MEVDWRVRLVNIKMIKRIILVFMDSHNKIHRSNINEAKQTESINQAS